MDWLKARYEDEWQHFDARMQVRTAWVEPKAGGSTVFDSSKLNACQNRGLDCHFQRFSAFGTRNIQKSIEIYRNLTETACCAVEQAKNLGGLQAGSNWDDYTDAQWVPG